jgi:outer membrane protein assembly factor BamE (lipoprotein component of BamABCDE complex)
MRLRLLLALAVATAAAAGCATSRNLQPAQSTRADVEAALGQPAEVRTRTDGETWLYYPNQPFGRKVRVARVAPDGKLIAVEQRLSEEYIAKLIPNQSSRDDVLALFGRPYERLDVPRMERDMWTWHMRQYGILPSTLNVQMSPDGVVREIYVLDENDTRDGKKR